MVVLETLISRKVLSTISNLSYAATYNEKVQKAPLRHSRSGKSPSGLSAAGFVIIVVVDRSMTAQDGKLAPRIITQIYVQYGAYVSHPSSLTNYVSVFVL